MDYHPSPLIFTSLYSQTYSGSHFFYIYLDVILHSSTASDCPHLLLPSPLFTYSLSHMPLSAYDSSCSRLYVLHSTYVASSLLSQWPHVTNYGIGHHVRSLLLRILPLDLQHVLECVRQVCVCVSERLTVYFILNDPVRRSTGGDSQPQW